MTRTMLWEFTSAAGNAHRGTVKSVHDYGGTDVSLVMESACGSTLVLSGQRYRDARALNRLPADDESCPHGRTVAY